MTTYVKHYYATVFALTLALSPALLAQSPPDFSGVYYPVQQGRGGGRAGGAPPAGAQRQGPPITLTRAATNEEHRVTIRARATRRRAGVSTALIRAPLPTCKEPVIRTRANTLITTTSVNGKRTSPICTTEVRPWCR